MHQKLLSGNLFSKTVDRCKLTCSCSTLQTNGLFVRSMVRDSKSRRGEFWHQFFAACRFSVLSTCTRGFDNHAEIGLEVSETAILWFLGYSFSVSIFIASSTRTRVLSIRSMFRHWITVSNLKIFSPTSHVLSCKILRIGMVSHWTLKARMLPKYAVCPWSLVRKLARFVPEENGVPCRGSCCETSLLETQKPAQSICLA